MELKLIYTLIEQQDFWKKRMYSHVDPLKFANEKIKELIKNNADDLDDIDQFLVKNFVKDLSIAVCGAYILFEQPNESSRHCALAKSMLAFENGNLEYALSSYRRVMQNNSVTITGFSELLEKGERIRSIDNGPVNRFRVEEWTNELIFLDNKAQYGSARASYNRTVLKNEIALTDHYDFETGGDQIIEAIDITGRKTQEVIYSRKHKNGTRLYFNPNPKEEEDIICKGAAFEAA